MRILHTADWHLGRSFHGESLLAAQAAAVEHVVAAARAERVGAVVIAGDLYDRALPPVDAVRLADEALRRLSEVCPVVVISGNHDSAPRLGFGSGAAGARRPARAHRPASARRARRARRRLRSTASRTWSPTSRATRSGATGAATGRCWTRRWTRVRTDLARRPAGTRAVVVAHAFVAGAAPCDCERDLAVGGAASVSAATFAGADYVALGHLHGPQRIGSRRALRRLAGGRSRSRRRGIASRSRWSTWTRATSSWPSVPGDAPARRAARHARRAAGRPGARRRTSPHGCRRRSPIPRVPPTRWSACAGASRTRCCWPSSPRAAPPRPRAPTRSACAGSTTRSCVASFVRDVRGAEAGEEELALLRDALTAGRVAEVSG